jgi:hypothetical protein
LAETIGRLQHPVPEDWDHLDCNTLIFNASNKEKTGRKINNLILRTSGKSHFQEKISSFIENISPAEGLSNT